MTVEIRRYDEIYGEIRLPCYLRDLINTGLAARARRITMGTVPNHFRDTCLPSRFQHGVGAAHLAQIVCEKNSTLSFEEQKLIIVSALMHDWGNTPFAHLAERLLKERLGCDGESFLARLFDFSVGAGTLAALHKIDVNPKQVVSMITGKHKPLSKVLHGSLDVDNLDNVVRYALHTGRLSDSDKRIGVQLASSFVWEDSQWKFSNNPNLLNWVRRWKDLRRQVYQEIYSVPHSVVVTMLFDLLWAAHEQGHLSNDFFLHDDEQALTDMLTISPSMMERLRLHQFLHQIVSYEITDPSDRLKEISNTFEIRIGLARKFAELHDLPPGDVSVYVGPDRMEREVDILVAGDESGRTVEQMLLDKGYKTLPVVYRVQINIQPDRARDLFKAAEAFAQGVIM